MAQSLLTLYPANSWTNRYSTATKRHLHWALQAIGCVAILVGIVIEIYLKEDAGRNHFRSDHAITGKWKCILILLLLSTMSLALRLFFVLGLVSLIFIALSILNGIAAMYTVKIKHLIKPVYVKMCHYLTGIVAFVIGECGSVWIARTFRLIERATATTTTLFAIIPFSPPSRAGMTSLALEYSPRMLSVQHKQMLIAFTTITTALTLIGVCKTMTNQCRNLRQS